MLLAEESQLSVRFLGIWTSEDPGHEIRCTRLTLYEGSEMTRVPVARA